MIQFIFIYLLLLGSCSVSSQEEEATETQQSNKTQTTLQTDKGDSSSHDEFDPAIYADLAKLYVVAGKSYSDRHEGPSVSGRIKRSVQSNVPYQQDTPKIAPFQNYNTPVQPTNPHLISIPTNNGGFYDSPYGPVSNSLYVGPDPSLKAKNSPTEVAKPKEKDYPKEIQDFGPGVVPQNKIICLIAPCAEMKTLPRPYGHRGDKPHLKILSDLYKHKSPKFILKPTTGQQYPRIWPCKNYIDGGEVNMNAFHQSSILHHGYITGPQLISHPC